MQFFVLLRLPQREMHRRQFRPSPANLFSPRDKLVSRGPIRLFDSFLRFRPEGGRGGEGATPGVSQGVLRALLSNRRLSSVSPLINIYAVLPNTWSHSRDHRRSGSFSVPPVFNYTAIFAAPSYSPRRWHRPRRHNSWQRSTTVKVTSRSRHFYLSLSLYIYIGSLLFRLSVVRINNIYI